MSGPWALATPVRSRQAKAADVARCLIFMRKFLFKGFQAEGQRSPSRANAQASRGVWSLSKRLFSRAGSPHYCVLCCSILRDLSPIWGPKGRATGGQFTPSRWRWWSCGSVRGLFRARHRCFSAQEWGFRPARTGLSPDQRGSWVRLRWASWRQDAASPSFPSCLAHSAIRSHGAGSLGANWAACAA